MAYVRISKGWPALKWDVWAHLPLFQVDKVPKKLLLIEIFPGRAKEEISFTYKQLYPHRPVNGLSLADKYCACGLLLVHTRLEPLPISVTWEVKTAGRADANTSTFTLWTCGCHFAKHLAFPLPSSYKMAYELYWNVYAGVPENLRDNALKSHLLWLETTDWMVKWLISSHKLKADISNNH